MKNRVRAGVPAAQTPTGEERTSAFLRELPGKSVFEGQVLEIAHEWGVDYDVQNGGWSEELPDTWLSEHVLRRFKGKRVRVTIQEVGDA